MRAGRIRQMHNPEGRRMCGRWIRGEKQGRSRGDVQRCGGDKEEDGGKKYNSGTGEQETEQDRGVTGKQRQIRGEVLRVWD